MKEPHSGPLSFRAQNRARISTDLRYRFLDGACPEAFRALQAVHDAAPAYSQVVFGRLPDGTEAGETFTSTPPGFPLEQKFVLGIYLEDELMGVAELLKGYPEGDIAYIGLLLFKESHQKQGLGSLALNHITELACQWGCTAIRIAVIASNGEALGFWLRHGFSELFRKNIPGVTAEAIVMQRPIPCPGLSSQGRLDGTVPPTSASAKAP